MLRIGIADDHRLFRTSLKLLINSFANMEVVLDAENGNDLLNKLEKIPVDIVLLDIQMPDLDGFETCSILIEKHPNIKILIVSQLNSKENITKALSLGVNGYFTKNSDPEEIEKAILNVGHHDLFFGKDIGMVMKGYLELHGSIIPELPSMQVSKRELEIIKLACKEYSSAEIAAKLFISARTVDSHRKHLMEKFEAKNFVGVILQCLKNEIVTVDDF